MRSIEVSSQFKRDAKKNYLSLLTPAWGEVLNCLTNDLPIPKKYKDHALTGNYKGFREIERAIIKPVLSELDELSNLTFFEIFLNMFLFCLKFLVI